MKKRIKIKEYEHDQVEYIYENESIVYSCTKVEYRIYQLKSSIFYNGDCVKTKLDEFERLVYSDGYKQGYQDCFEENE